jgi:hypothetical protein
MAETFNLGDDAPGALDQRNRPHLLIEYFVPR